jgi:hypothetical protein
VAEHGAHRDDRHVPWPALLLFLHLFGKYKAKYPAIPYVAVIIVGIVAGIYLKLPMLHIEHTPIKLALPFPDFDKIPPAMLLEIFGYAMMLSLIDVIEQVTSNAAIEKLDPLGRPANTNNSLLAIWIANMGSSFFGGMTNLDGLAKSATNALAGAVTKMSNLFTGLVLLIFLHRSASAGASALFLARRAHDLHRLEDDRRTRACGRPRQLRAAAGALLRHPHLHRRHLSRGSSSCSACTCSSTSSSSATRTSR